MTFKTHALANGLCARVDVTSDQIRRYVEAFNYKQAQKACSHMKVLIKQLEHSLRILRG
mgnify:CR=1 FL=1